MNLIWERFLSQIPRLFRFFYYLRLYILLRSDPEIFRLSSSPSNNSLTTMPWFFKYWTERFNNAVL